MLIKIDGGKNPECPLCKKTFEKIPYRGEWFFMCEFCEIFIDVKDPAIFAWAAYKPEEDKEIMCPNGKCRNELNFFFRSDGYMKSYCPKCFSSVSLSENLPIPKEMLKAREEGGE